MLRVKALLILLLFTPNPKVWAQFYSFSHDFATEAFIDVQKLENPFSGSYNSGQFFPCDLNNDGQDDLIVYDKSARKTLTYQARLINGNYNWIYNPDFEDMIPPIQSWLATADFNCDGKKDIFTQTSAGIKVFRNTSDTPGQVSFVLETDGLTSQGNNGQVNIQVNPFGAPAFTDVDNDGDLDILTFDFSGNTVEYHQNLIFQNTGSCAGFQLKKDSCVFGLFATKPACGQIRLNTGCLGQRPGGGENPDGISKRIQHIGSQLSAMDLDGDGDKDLLVGDLGCSLLNRLVNGGTTSDALITSADTLFPSAQQYVKVAVFPSAYRLDANFDGKADLVITPTFFSNYSDGFANNSKVGTHLYIDQSNGPVPDFQLVEKDFFQNQCIETGEEAIPAFADVDADGDQDLFVGHLGSKNGQLLQSSIYFYRNIGSVLQARFSLVSTDYLGLSSLFQKRIRPLFQDFNNDGALDFGWIASPGTIQTDSTRLRFLLNQNPAGQSFLFPSLSQIQLFPFAFNLYDSPVFIDIDGDLVKDMLVGKYNGKIQYWKQTSPWPTIQYTLMNNNYGNIARAPFSTNPCLAIADADKNGNPDLIVGDFTGNIKIYRDFKNNTGNIFPADSLFYFNSLFNQRINHALGNFASPALADLNGDDYPEMAIGLSGGGMNLLINNLGPNGAPNKVNPSLFTELWKIYPNPIAQKEPLQWNGPQPDKVELYNGLGVLIITEEYPKTGSIHFPQNLPSGLYHLQFHKSGMRQVFKLQMKSND